jgi:hypothetical protein
MRLRFFIDPETDEPHIYGHGIVEEEVRQVLRGPGEVRRGRRRNSRMKLGRTYAGRYIQVVYVPDEVGDGIFVVTAFELHGNAKAAFRRRNRRKP